MVNEGWQPTFSDAAITFGLTIKCLYGLALSQATGMIESNLHLAVLDWAVPVFSIRSRRKKDL
ncbi:transposase [Aquitalea aquatilis]|uniref:transposase n=1 Tax=Aquitalea aquatilis TaxID=1537400 RepID=UPI0010BDFEE2